MTFAVLKKKTYARRFRNNKVRPEREASHHARKYVHAMADIDMGSNSSMKYNGIGLKYGILVFYASTVSY